VADEQMVPLAVSGDWVAAAHQTSMTAAPDVCIVMNQESGVAFRAAIEGIEFRVANSTWSLPSNVQGSIFVAVGQWNATLQIVDNTDTMVGAEVDADTITPMFNAMDKATSMSVTVGKARPFSVSLAGSTRATNAFRTCAHIEGPVKAPGSNPFQ
jgi:hypothetical protein